MDDTNANSNHVGTDISACFGEERKTTNDGTGTAKGMADVLANARYQLYGVSADSNQGGNSG